MTNTAAQSIQPSDMHTVGIQHVCHDIRHHVSYDSFSANNESQRTLSVRHLTTLSQQAACAESMGMQSSPLKCHLWRYVAMSGMRGYVA